MDIYQTDTYKKIHFAVMAIEASAKKAHLSGKEMHDRLKRQGLIRKRLFRHYEQLRESRKKELGLRSWFLPHED